MDVGTVTAVVGTGATVLGAIAVTARYAVTHLRTLSREMAQWREDWYGEVARPGFDARPGIPERIKKIEYQLTSNGGASMRDAVTRVELNQNRLAIDQGIQARKLDDHLREMGPMLAYLNEWRRQQIEGVPPDEDPGAGG